MRTGLTYRGIGASGGVALGPIWRLQQEAPVFSNTASDPIAERTRFERGRMRAVEETARLVARMEAAGNATAADILTAHRMLLEDAALASAIEAGICNGLSAGAAVKAAIQPFIGAFAAAEDEIMREKAADMADIQSRLLGAMYAPEHTAAFTPGAPCLLAAAELPPSALLQFDAKRLAGIITETGGKTAHAAILAKSLGIPAVVGLAGAMALLMDGMEAAIDGESGEVWLAPDAAQRAEINRRIQAQRQAADALTAYCTMETITRDGQRVKVEANILDAAEADAAMAVGAEGVGLFRSEFLFLAASALPSEQAQARAYRRAAERLGGREVIIRTLDVGGDKPLPALAQEREENPFLGCRGIRLCLAREPLFLEQLRALLRASTAGPIKIMLPMVACLDELLAAKALLARAKAELSAEGVPFAADVQVGVMIEAPAAAMLADVLAKHCDFFSIGTNDLTQYTLCVDRGNEQVAALYDAAHPAVLRLCSTAIRAAQAAGIPCGMCGDAAADPALIPIFLGLGLSAFSVPVASVPAVRKQICGAEFAACQALAQRALSCAQASEVRTLTR